MRTTTPDPGRHNAYLATLGRVERFRAAMIEMSRAAGAAGDACVAHGEASPAAATKVAEYVTAIEDLGVAAREYLASLQVADPPTYFRGAHVDVEAAVELMVDASSRGAAAGRAGRRQGLDTAAAEIDAASRDMISAASRITNWGSGAASP